MNNEQYVSLSTMLDAHRCDLTDLCGKYIAGTMPLTDRIQFSTLICLIMSPDDVHKWATIRLKEYTVDLQD